MSASRFLAELWQRGVVVGLNGDRSNIVVARRQLSPEMQVRLEEDKPQLLQLLAFADDFRALIRNAFGALVDRASARQALDELADDQARLTDELGPELASTIRDREARQWAQETGLCPVCFDLEPCDACADDAGDEDADDTESGQAGPGLR
jgi:hypothetical protein